MRRKNEHVELQISAEQIEIKSDKTTKSGRIQKVSETSKVSPGKKQDDPAMVPKGGLAKAKSMVQENK